MRNLYEFEPAPSRLQVVSEGRDAIVAHLRRERRAAGPFDAWRAAWLIDQVRGGAPFVIFGGVSYRVDGL